MLIDIQGRRPFMAPAFFVLATTLSQYPGPHRSARIDVFGRRQATASRPPKLQLS